MFKEDRRVESHKEIYLYLSCIYDECPAKIVYHQSAKKKALSNTHNIHSATDCLQTVAMEMFDQKVDSLSRDLGFKASTVYKNAKDFILQNYAHFKIPDTKKVVVRNRVKYLKKKNSTTRTAQVR